jgi:glycine hydroxymethyltransferase
VSAEITVNKNMVPFDDKSPFVTSGIRIGTPAITTRGLNVSDMSFVANAIDRVIMNASNEDVIRAVKMEVHEQMSSRPLFA